MLTRASVVLIVHVLFAHVLAQSPPGDVVGKMSIGFQGWFTCAGDGSPRGNLNTWVHWSADVPPSPGNVDFELYPDVREYTTLYPTQLGNLGNGQPARLFSSWDNQTIDTQFRWVQENNIEVIALQRFGAAIRRFQQFEDQVNGMVFKVMQYTQNHGLKFFIQYDTSDWANFPTELVPDILNLRANGIFDSVTYARQNNKPVLSLWGFGFTNRPDDQVAALSIITQLKNLGFYVIGGVPGNWRTGDSDSKPNYIDVYRAFNMIQPWSIGRFRTIPDAINYQSRMADDLADCNSRGVDYQPVVYPGFAWSNWMQPPSPPNVIPRLHGDFMWQQFVNVRTLSITNVYVAMLDEYDEGTAIGKAAENVAMVPNNQYFLTLDADGVRVSSDFYLRLTKDGNSMIKGQIPLQNSHPTPHTL